MDWLFDQCVKIKEWFAYQNLKFLAYYRLNDKAVCTMSAGMGEVDYHDYHDTAEEFPDHFAVLTCKRCGKKFRI